MNMFALILQRATVLLLVITACCARQAAAQYVKQGELTGLVNVFLGTSGDHGQLSPAANSPFGLLSIGPQTYPSNHAGYEFLAKEFLGFTHNRFEGTGCRGSGGNILLKPFLGDTGAIQKPLIKLKDVAGPGYYNCSFTNGIKAAISVNGNSGSHQYQFPSQKTQKSIYLDLKHAFHNDFVAEHHVISKNSIKGWVDSKTTCNMGVFRTYYYLELDKNVKWSEKKDYLIGVLSSTTTSLRINIAVSSVDEAHAEATAKSGKSNHTNWEKLLSRIKVNGDASRKALFYSLLYRTLQSPFLISETDGTYRTIDGSLKSSADKKYNGWAIWDNYKTQLPLLSIVYPDSYQDIVTSISDLYLYGKKDFSTKKEPSNSVRTEHAVVVLLDAWKKGFKVNFEEIIDSLVAENNRLDYATPDKALESAYDDWALGQIFKIMGVDSKSELYLNKALNYRKRWLKDFSKLNLSDVDQMSARKMYQGTIRQYRWSIPFDVKGLKELCGGEIEFCRQLDEFFDHDYFNRTNEPDLLAHNLYNATSTPWKAQYLVHKFAVDTVINNYFNDNSRGIGSEIDRVYKNQPAAFIRTMDDDAGAMSSWFILAALGLQPANVGAPVYYLNAPLFDHIEIPVSNGKVLKIWVKNFNMHHAYVSSVSLNGKNIDRNWITHKELMEGGEMEFVTASTPDYNWGLKNQWISSNFKN